MTTALTLALVLAVVAVLVGVQRLTDKAMSSTADKLDERIAEQLEQAFEQRARANPDAVDLSTIFIGGAIVSFAVLVLLFITGNVANGNPVLLMTLVIAGAGSAYLHLRAQAGEHRAKSPAADTVPPAPESHPANATGQLARRAHPAPTKATVTARSRDDWNGVGEAPVAFHHSWGQGPGEYPTTWHPSWRG